MSAAHFDDETLMAFADGEADAITARQVEQAMQDDRDIAARVELFRRSAALAKQAFEADLDLAVPESLRASVAQAIEQAERAASSDTSKLAGSEANQGTQRIESFASVGRMPGASSGWAANQPRFALAASVAAFVIGALGYLAGARLGDGGGVQVASGFSVMRNAAEQSAFVNVLDTLASGRAQRLGGESAAASIEILATVRDRAGSLCREFRIERGEGATLGVACRSQQQWAVTFAATSPPGETGFAPASSTPALDAYLSAIEAGPALSAEEELAALRGTGK